MALTKIKLNELTPKAAPVLADGVLLSDSADGGRGKISTLSDLQTLIGGGGAVDSVAGKTGVVTLDASDIAETAALKIMTADERTKLTGIAEGAEVNTVDSVAGKTGVVTLDADDVSPTATKLWMSDTQSAKLAGIAENANNYTHPASHPQSMIEGLGTDLAAKAPLASPALTGTPTAPTAEAGTNTTQIATTAFVTGAVAGVSAADAVKLTGDQSIAGIKTFTSSPVLPTPTAGDDTTKAATTAFVQDAVAGVTASSIGLGSVDNTADSAKPVSTAQAAAIAARRPKHTYTEITTADTAIAAERGKTYGVNANGCTLTLPACNTPGYVDGDEICVIVGVSSARILSIVSPSSIVRGTGLQAANTPFNIFGMGKFISFAKCGTAWTMGYPEYDLAEKAPLASPALIGAPTAPTQAAGTNNTRIATTAFVQGAVASKANDADVVKLTGNQSIEGTKTFTTSPVLPTPTAGDNSTKGATTAFVSGAVAASRPKHAYTGITTASTSITAERGNTYGVNANDCTLTLPNTSTSGYVDGDEICVIVGISAERTLSIKSPSYITRGTGLQPVNTPFTVSGYGTVITFTKCSNVWAMSYPEYALDGKAPLASPALTGNPTAPTQAAGTNNTRIATTAFVQAKASGALLTEGTPSGPTATGTKGMARFDANYFYVCTATDTWVRFAKDGAWT